LRLNLKSCLSGQLFLALSPRNKKNGVLLGMNLGRTIIFRKEFVSGIPFYLFLNKKATKTTPFVIFLHGLGSSASSLFGNCADLARAGFNAASFDLRNHGDRCLKSSLNGFKENCACEEDFFRRISDLYALMLGSMSDLRLLIDLLQYSYGLALGEIGLAGVSLGGHISLLSFIQEPRIKTVVSLLGCGDYYRLSQHRTQVYGYSLEAFEKYYDENLSLILNRFDPVNHVEKLAQRPLLLIHNRKDRVVPGICNELFYRRASEAYHDKSRIVYSLHEKLGHELSTALWKESRNWFLKTLKQ